MSLVAAVAAAQFRLIGVDIPTVSVISSGIVRGELIKNILL